jgi:hypothetical protein
MPVRLIVKWDGDIPGLGEGRLSLNVFGKALTHLSTSLRRIATNLVHGALREQEATTGRLTNAALEIDVQPTHLLTNSAGIDSLVTISSPPGQAFSLFEELPANATLKFLDAVEAERQGRLTNASVRRYLESLPGGLSKQSYSVYRDGTSLREISFGEVRLARPPLDVPYLAEYVGAIVGVGFEPGQPEVRIQTDTSLVTLTATSLPPLIPETHEGYRASIINSSRERYAKRRPTVEEQINCWLAHTRAGASRETAGGRKQFIVT